MFQAKRETLEVGKSLRRIEECTTPLTGGGTVVSTPVRRISILSNRGEESVAAFTFRRSAITSSQEGEEGTLRGGRACSVDIIWGNIGGRSCLPDRKRA